MKLSHLFGDPPVQVAARQLYVRAVHQARRPEFYLHCNVPDTVDGRFDMIVLHVVLVMRRLKRDHDRAAETAQALFDLMFADMDQNLREMGVGDIAIGKRVKALAKSFFGRLAAYDLALNAEDDLALCSALRRNVYRKSSPSDGHVMALAAYVRRESARLEGLPIKVLLSGDLSFESASLPKGETNEQSV